jgi:hypothetical protein
MRIVAMVFVLRSLPLLAVLSCQSAASPAGSDAGGTTIPSEDGAVCSCASPDCLPNCSDLPACKIECVLGERLAWVDPCGNTNYAEPCTNGCLVDAAIPKCQ